jgi:predicted ATP-binding protein involved in virulence
MSNFITEIKIGKVRHLENIDIVLGDEKKHLILTGKNGSGKTSVLERLDVFFKEVIQENGQIEVFYNYKDKLNTLDKIQHKSLLDIIYRYEACYPIFNQEKFYQLVKNRSLNFIYTFFSATRVNKTDKPQGINKIIFSKEKTKKLNQKFLQYIVNLKAERSFARDDNDMKVVKKIDDWFYKFENILKQIFGDDKLTIKFDRKNYNFIIHKKNREPFDFNGLSAGYSAIIDIVTELILKIENTESKSFDCEGIVLIDEVENHLHVELQKNILPLLTSFFPNIQFIVTTHSPFVLQSIKNSVVYDLERKEQLSGGKLVSASYTDIVKNYFEVDSQFSKILESEIIRYENLVDIFEKNSLTMEEEKELLELDIKLDKIALMLSDTIYLRFKEAQDRISEDG